MFQSTRPMRGATWFSDSFSTFDGFQSTRPMRGATSAHLHGLTEYGFQSTRPMRGATHLAEDFYFVLGVSIHAPHAGRDGRKSSRSSVQSCFNPRAPCGARLEFGKVGIEFQMFQSTRPMRGATAKEVTTSLFCHIFMGITRHKYDFLDVLAAHAPIVCC